jgi:hypothetical protein
MTEIAKFELALALTFLILVFVIFIYIPLERIAEKEYLKSRVYQYSTSAGEQLKRRGSIGSLF